VCKWTTKRNVGARIKTPNPKLTARIPKGRKGRNTKKKYNVNGKKHVRRNRKSSRDAFLVRESAAKCDGHTSVIAFATTRRKQAG
jgi:hypothetical protein